MDRRGITYRNVYVMQDITSMEYILPTHNANRFESGTSQRHLRRFAPGRASYLAYRGVANPSDQCCQDEILFRNKFKYRNAIRCKKYFFKFYNFLNFFMLILAISVDNTIFCFVLNKTTEMQ